MFKNIIPRNDVFFEMFDRIAENIVKGIQVFKKMIDEESLNYSQELKTVEHQTDEIVHSAMHHLHKTFVTPIDREDIHRLLNRLDDILDLTQVAGSSIKHYKPKHYPKDLKDLVNTLLESAKFVREMISLTRDIGKNSKKILELAVEINRLENEADYIRRTMVGKLFSEEQDPIELIKWKDILEYIEKATDRCEDVGDVVEGIVLQNS